MPVYPAYMREDDPLYYILYNPTTPKLRRYFHLNFHIKRHIIFDLRGNVMESRWYLAPGQTLENTNISDRQHALHVTKTAWNKLNAHLDRKRLIAEALEKERAYRQAMKEGSDAMIEEWPDSIERSHNRKQEEKKQRAREIEEEKAQKYMEITKEQEDMKQAYIEKVKRSMYYSKAYPKRLNGALLESEAIYEREKQLQFKEVMKEHERQEEQKWADLVRQGAEDEEREKLEKWQEDQRIREGLKEANLKSWNEQEKFIKQQRENRKKKQIADNEALVKEIKLQEQFAKEDIQKHRETTRKELLDYIAKDKAFKARVAKEEAEVDEVIKIFAEAKRNIECLRKEKDREILQEAILKREQAGKKVVAIQRAKDEAYLNAIQKTQEEVARKEEEKQQKKLEKEKQMRLEREEDRRVHTEHEQKVKAEEKEIKRWEMLNRQKQEAVTKEYLEEKRQKDWQKTLQHRSELLAQIEEKKLVEKEEKEEAMRSDDYIMAEIDDEEFFTYADTLVDYCKKNDRPIYPILKVVQDYKKVNMLEDKKDPKCESYLNDKYANRREKLVNTTPGKMLHDRRTDPNYRRCKCCKERLYR
ncbi:hypothetical protein Trydic_g19390 [Trypoxylus dichotomus]